MYKTTLYIPVGISGQGKSTYGISMNDSVKVVSCDTINKSSKTDISTEETFELMREQAKEYLSQSYSVFFDAPNLKEKYRKELIKELGGYAEYVVGIYFPVDIQKAKQNNETRHVFLSDENLELMADSLEKIHFNEGFDTIWTLY